MSIKAEKTKLDLLGKITFVLGITLSTYRSNLWIYTIWKQSNGVEQSMGNSLDDNWINLANLVPNS